MIDRDELLEERLSRLMKDVSETCAKVGRQASEVTIIGVAKTRSAELIRRAQEVGVLDIGENYVQELQTKYESLKDLTDLRWHFIGHLQRNKVRVVLPMASMIHSVDSERLANELDKRAGLIGRTIPILLQVNTSGEESKYGCDPSEVKRLGEHISGLEYLDLQGMMTLAAFLDDSEAVRPMFRKLRLLRDELQHDLGKEMPHLSMGMTNDFRTAIEEGATMIRIGTALFGERTYS